MLTEDPGSVTHTSHANEWTIGTLLFYIHRLLEDAGKLSAVERAALKENVDLRFDAAHEALQKAEISSEKRFESVNEFRRTLSDQAAHFVTRPDIDAVNEKIAAISSRMDKSESKGQGLQSGWLILVAAVGLIATIAVLWKTTH